MKSNSVAVVGLGAWGTALAHHFASVGADVASWSRNSSIVEDIKTNRRNSKYLPGVKLHSGINPSTSLEVIKGKEIVVYSVPASSLSTVVSLSKAFLSEDTIIVSGIKGMTKDSLTPLSLFKDQGLTLKMAVLSGPSFAIDLVRGQPVSFVLACESLECAIRISECADGPTVKVYQSTDVIGVEWGGILKNIVAIAVGISDGLQLGDSSRAALITRGLAEMVPYAVRMGAEKETLFGLTGLGDLLMTASSDKSRNRRFGLRIGRGEHIASIISEPGMTVEALHSLPLVLSNAKKHGIQMPIAETLEKVIRQEIPVHKAVELLLSRPMKKEN